MTEKYNGFNVIGYFYVLMFQKTLILYFAGDLIEKLTKINKLPILFDHALQVFCHRDWQRNN